MRSVTTERFRRAYSALPERIKVSARAAYQKWKKSPNHPGLQFKQIQEKQSIYSIRINLAYRALAVKQGNTVIWFWIGSHAEYDKLIASL